MERTKVSRTDGLPGRLPAQRLHRGLRLSAILAEFGGEADAIAPAPGEAGAGEAHDDGPPITVGVIADRTAHAGFGFFFGFLTLVSVPFVGLSTPFGLAIAFGAVQMILGLRHPWLPARIRRVRVSPKLLSWISSRLSRWTAGLERVVRPRFELLTRGPFWALCGVCILSQALILALPLAIPGTNVPFMATIVLYAIGLLESDGLLIMFCHAIVAAQIALAFLFWEIISHALLEAFRWLMPLLG
jgi:hypothetical protein